MPYPPREGLYDPQFERDACGIGFVVNVNGRRSHDILEKGIQVLLNLQHRGACGCDPETGDGAGITLQVPHEFYERACYDLRMTLPNPGEYGVGMIFLPVERTQRLLCEGVVEEIIRKEGQRVLGWRDVPVDSAAIGLTARTSQPYIRQVFIGKAKRLDEDAFERKLYVIRKRIENNIYKLIPDEVAHFYIPSMSARTVVYKGLMLASQIKPFYKDLADPHAMSALALIHQRFSTNTFPTWELAHPFRYVAHNGEINTLKGNVNWMHARESVLKSELFNGDLARTFPIISPGGSDSANIDNALELLVQAGRSVPHALLMLIPEAWTTQQNMDPDLRAFYEYHASLMEPWDGPAAIAFTDGRLIGAILDRNGLRPCRYTVTYDDFVVLASETGVLPIPPDNVRHKDRLQPGRMLLIDTVQGRIISDGEIKDTLAHRRPYTQWLRDNLITIESLPQPPHVIQPDHETILMRQRAFGYTDEDLRLILAPMAKDGEEPVGSMGNDAALACLSDKPRLLFDYFKQLFAQVTNPPIDPIREELVMSLVSYIGKEGNILDETPKNCHTLKLKHPILTNYDLEKLRNVQAGDFLAATLPALYPVQEAGKGLEKALDELCAKASEAARTGYPVIILSDRGVTPDLAPIPCLLALSAVHHHLIRDRLRTQVALVVESGEPREVMHFALLIGYGASAINPYLAVETLADMLRRGQMPPEVKDFDEALDHYLKSIKKGLLKTISKMGISTIQSYCGAQIFEAVGLDRDLVERYFTGTTSRISGVGLDVIAREAALRHAFAMTPRTETDTDLDVGGQYQYRVRGERHLFNPVTISKLQHAVRENSWSTYKEYSDFVNDQAERLCTLRGLFRFQFEQCTPIPIEEVEPAAEIVKRFKTGAMSFGSISKEAHETLAIAMNRIGGKSNTGEGGEDEERFQPDANGDWRRSAIKQVASARFGVTIHYLVNCDELQIKMAQGAKPGEGGQLPGRKVDAVIARIRHSIPGVGLISPPPHHDIYSIEDLAQLIYDLKNANHKARISVKLVAEAGVGIVAAGVSKAHADVVLISGHDGGTGASPLSSIKHAGIPWEVGLSETQQVLVKNDLRGRIVVETDGQMKTGRDVAIACLLGAEEFGFATAPLVSMGCIMMRKCHLNTCPVGVATQDPVLRARFTGKPEHVINFLFFVAEELRGIMAQLGIRTVNEMVGRSDLLETDQGVQHWKARGLDFSEIFYRPHAPERVARYHCQTQDHGLSKALDWKLIELSEAAVERQERVDLEMPIRNVHRTVGTILSGEIARRYGSAGLAEDTIYIKFHGSAGQSFGAFLAKGVTFELEGDTCDYMGKGLSGGKMIIYPPRASRFVPEENIVVGNVCLYGATGGEVYLQGKAGERFAVRNSGALAVVEGAGDHCCEYMTRGCVVVLGKTGRNFAAGMSSGIAFVLDELGDFAEKRCNRSMVGLEPVVEPEDIQLLHTLIEKHHRYTGSPRAEWILEGFDHLLPKFIKVMPHEYKAVLAPNRDRKGADAPIQQVARG